MARKLVWAADARRDLRDLFMFVATRNLAAADRLEQLIVEGAERVALLPLAYRPGRALDTREAILHPTTF
ncbi:type II toxin-antitoxin system RelE/ParE family toxin [Sphingomonas sp. LT1P40]|uniref:type II toxin-antitoxin system RelE/ParE family toxin n=1 Tax=Alteristakelama amylovorans TaxID=3096166 RepID=UPI002FCA08DB